MSVYFFDTSALVKRYYHEAGTEQVDTLIEGDNTIVITSLSVIEIASAFRRKYNRGELTRDEVDGLLTHFFEEALETFQLLPLEESFLEFSFELILEDDLRTLDSLQLSAALSLPNETELIFVCADSDLVATAKGYGLETINPAE